MFWDRQSERLGCLEIDDQLILCRQLHGEVGRLFALEDAVDVGCRLRETVRWNVTIRDQAAVSCKITQWIKRRKAIPRRQPQNFIAIVDRDGVWRDD